MVHLVLRSNVSPSPSNFLWNLSQLSSRQWGAPPPPPHPHLRQIECSCNFRDALDYGRIIGGMSVSYGISRRDEARWAELILLLWRKIYVCYCYLVSYDLSCVQTTPKGGEEAKHLLKLTLGDSRSSWSKLQEVGPANKKMDYIHRVSSCSTFLHHHYHQLHEAWAVTCCIFCFFPLFVSLFAY